VRKGVQLWGSVGGFGAPPRGPRYTGRRCAKDGGYEQGDGGRSTSPRCSSARMQARDHTSQGYDLRLSLCLSLCLSLSLSLCLSVSRPLRRLCLHRFLSLAYIVSYPVPRLSCLLCSNVPMLSLSVFCACRVPTRENACLSCVNARERNGTGKMEGEGSWARSIGVPG
jgi:hypothetical protein